MDNNSQLSSLEMEKTKESILSCPNDASSDRKRNLLIKQNRATDENNSRQDKNKFNETAKQIDKITALFLPLFFFFIATVYWIAFFSHRYSFVIKIHIFIYQIKTFGLLQKLFLL